MYKFLCLAAIFCLLSDAGFVTDEEVKHRELKLRDALKTEPEFIVKESASVEVAQVKCSVSCVEASS